MKLFIYSIIIVLHKSADYQHRESNEAKVYFVQNNLVGKKNVNPDCIKTLPITFYKWLTKI